MTIPPDANAFALAQRNFDAIPIAGREKWFDAFRTSPRTHQAIPERVIVELANTCNLDCPMCRVGEHGVDFRRIMPLELFKRVAAEVFAGARDVRLNGLGETTLIPDLESYLEVLAAYPVNIELITNGTGRCEIYATILNRGGTILFSWDAATPTRFEQLRRPARFDAVYETVRLAAHHAAQIGRVENLYLLFTLQPGNRKEVSPVVAIASELGIPSVVVNLAKLRDDRWLTAHADEILESFEDAEGIARATRTRLFLPDRVGPRTLKSSSAMKTAASGCDRPWKEVVIRWDLDVQVCNMFNPYTYGNLRLRSFKEIWEGAFAHTFRMNLHSSAPHPYCVGCAYIGDVYAHNRA